MEAVYPGCYLMNNKVLEGISSSEYEPDYSLIGPSLFHNGLSITQINNSIKGVVTWQDWRQSVKSLGVLDDWTLNLLFEYPKSFCADIRKLISGKEKLNINENATYRFPIGVVTERGYRPKFTEWSFSGAGGNIINSSDTCALVSFSSPGEKKIVAKILFPGESVPKTQTKTVYVSDYPIQKFAKPPYSTETDYKVYYYVPANATGMYLTINSITTLTYHDIRIVHDPVDKSFTFRFPQGFPVDYAVILTYFVVGAERTATILFSNIRNEDSILL